MGYLLARLESGTRWLWLLEELDEAATSRHVFGGSVPPRTDVVASKSSVAPLVDHYVSSALPGKTYICCGASGTGKTTAAMYLLHGDYKLRPRRGMLIQADDSADIATTFSKSLRAPDAAPDIHELLVASLIPPEKRRQAGTTCSQNPLDVLKAKLRKLQCFSKPFEVDLIRVRKGSLQETTLARPDCVELPLLIIDGLKKSRENKDFVGRLYRHAHASQVSVLIMVTEEYWADELIELNGGVKILPVDQVINNPREGDDNLSFTQKPDWKRMVWGLDDIKAFATLEEITDVKLRDGMTPEQVLDSHRRAQRTTGHVSMGVDGS